MDPTAPHDDLHDTPDFDIHVTRTNGELRAVVWLFGRRIELREDHDA